MKPSFFRPVTTLAAVAIAAVGVVSVAGPAAAAVSRHDGTVRYNWARNCESVLLGYPYVEASMGVVASVLYDDAAPPKTGEVFYVVVEGAALGDPYPCVGQKMRPDILLPNGFSLAVSPATPIRCFKWDYNGGGDPTSTPETALCPTAAQPPQSGGSASFGTSAGESWDMPQSTGYEIQVPVVASVAASTPVEFAVRVLDGNTNPLINVTSDYIGVVAGGTTTPTPPPPGPTPAASVTATVAPVVKLDNTRGKVPVKAVAGPVGSTARLAVRARVSGKWVVVGKTAYEVSGATATTVKVRVTKRWRQALDGRRVKAKLLAKVTAPAGDTAITTTTFVVKG
jgi:hypothetical protein